jgi:hypothetical protein
MTFGTIGDLLNNKMAYGFLVENADGSRVAIHVFASTRYAASCVLHHANLKFVERTGVNNLDAADRTAIKAGCDWRQVS